MRWPSIIQSENDMAGYLVLESFSSPEEVKEMQDRMAELLQRFDGSSTSIFSTINQVYNIYVYHISQAYEKLLSSSLTIVSATVDGRLLLRECREDLFFLWGFVFVYLYCFHDRCFHSLSMICLSLRLCDFKYLPFSFSLLLLWDYDYLRFCDNA